MLFINSIEFYLRASFSLLSIAQSDDYPHHLLRGVTEDKTLNAAIATTMQNLNYAFF